MQTHTLVWCTFLTLTVWALIQAPGDLQGQTAGTVSGRVLAAESGAGLSAVQVHIPALGLGTLTQNEGRFLIRNVPVGTHEIFAERIGYATMSQDIVVQNGQTTTVDLVVEFEALGLDEIIVTGTAGGTRRREVGNAIADIRLEDQSLGVSPTLEGLLQGKVAGMRVTLGGGQIGDGGTIRLRGNVSTALSNQPLIYIDGVRVRSDLYDMTTPVGSQAYYGTFASPSPLNDINPADIERIEVIKGPAASTLYGTEAATGVIQIFTKRGTSGAPVVTATIETGVLVKNISGPRKTLRGTPIEDFAQATSASGGTAKYQYLDPWMRNAVQQNYTMSVRGSTNPVTYFISGQAYVDDGIFLTEKDDGYSVRANLGIQITESLDLDFTSSYASKQIENQACGDNIEAICTWIQYYDQLDEPKEGFLDELVFNREDNTDIDRLITGATLRYRPVPEFTSKITLGYDRAETRGVTAVPFGFSLRPGGRRGVNDNTKTLLTLDNVQTYTYDVSALWTVDISAGFNWVTKQDIAVRGVSRDFAGPGQSTLSSGAIRSSDENRTRVLTGGFFGQAVFKFKDRYFLTAGVRRDGNSTFGQDFGWVNYPKFGASYVISDESFWPAGLGTVRLRGAWGTSGRAPGAFQARRTWDPIAWNGLSGYIPGNAGNPDLGPERTREIEAGIEGSFIDDRLGINFTWYAQKTTDGLLTITRPSSVGGFQDVLTNAGTLENRGVELLVNASVVRGSGFSFDLGGSIATNKSKILKLTAEEEFNKTGRFQVGQPVPVVTGSRVLNPDEIATPIIMEDVNFGPNVPTLMVNPYVTLGFPGGVVLNVRGEYNGGHFMRDSAGGWTLRQGGSQYATCMEAQIMIEAGQEALLTALERASCWQTDLEWQTYIYPADFFKLREVSVQIPLDFAVPQAASASITLSAGNIYRWVKDEFREYDPEARQTYCDVSTLCTTSLWMKPSVPKVFSVSLSVRY